MFRKRGAEEHGPICKRKEDQSSWNIGLPNEMRPESEVEATQRRTGSILKPF